MGDKQYKTNSYTDFFYYAFRNILAISIPLVIISTIILSLPHSSATNSGSSSDNLAITISSSCTLSSVVNISHNAEVYNGNYLGDIGKTTITTLCNDGNGYSVYAVGYSNNEEGNNRLINTEYPQYSIDTGLATSGLTSQWAMKLNNMPDDPSPTPPTIESDYNNVYGIVPPYWTKVAGRASGTTDMAEGSSFTTTYAVYASSSQYAGTYQGQVKYALIHPYKNEGTLTIEDTFALSGKNKINIAGVGEYYAMQDMDAGICNMVANDGTSTATQLLDTRDNNLYWVTKLKDGHCWMTQNLDLEIDATRTYTHNDTDLGWDPDSFDSNATWKPDTTNGKYNLPVNGTSVPGWSNQNNYPYSADPGDVYYYTSNSEANDIKYNSLSECIAANHTEGDCKHYHAGNYYNWSAAIASNNSTNIGSTAGEIASNSICPKGWRLPNASQTDNVNNEFGRMLYGEGITAALSNGDGSVGYYSGVTSFSKLRSNPYYFVRSGAVSDGTLVNPGVSSSCWSSTVGNSTYAYSLGFNGTDIYPASNYYRYYGRSVRCVAR
ncbi:hypothetical protein IIY68_03540 [Candidatus Saccharibacteria bacterium]|nr:hypothetical protein [Candidatus Saccharibacteria bacterium]